MIGKYGIFQGYNLPVVIVLLLQVGKCYSPAMSNRNGLLSQKLCHYLDQGRTLHDILFIDGRTWNGLL